MIADRLVWDDRQWKIASRWQAYDGELRANLLRVLAVLLFYAIHSWNFYFTEAVTAEFHRQMTLLSVAGLFATLAVALSLRFRYFPAWLSLATTTFDIGLISVALLLSRGPQSPLVVAYFLVIALAGLRFQLRLVWFATLACLLSYLIVLGGSHPDWFGGQRDFRIARYEELIFAAGLFLAGVVTGQTVRRVKAMAADFVRRRDLQRQET